jgi:hypothetical protein
MNEYLAFVSGKDLGGAGAHDDEGDEEGDEQHVGIRMWVSFFIFKHPKFGSKDRVVNPKAKLVGFTLISADSTLHDIVIANDVGVD